MSRRVKDTVERTYNVLDVRRTWTCGVTSENVNENKSNAPEKCELPILVIPEPIFGKRRNSSGNDKRTFNFNCNTNSNKCCPIYSALYLVSVCCQPFTFSIC